MAQPKHDDRLIVRFVVDWGAYSAGQQAAFAEDFVRVVLVPRVAVIVGPVVPPPPKAVQLPLPIAAPKVEPPKVEAPKAEAKAEIKDEVPPKKK